jgi:two-component system sensor histidine kinase YesM
VYGTFATYNVYDNIMENSYKNINLMIDVTIENLNLANSMISSTKFALSGSDSIRHWIDDQNYFSKNNKDYYLNLQKLNIEIQNILTNNNVWNFEMFDYVTIYMNSNLLGYTYTKPFSTKQIINDTKNVYNQIKIEEDYTLTLPPSQINKTIYTTVRIQSDFTSDNSVYIIGATKEDYFGDKYQELVSYEGAIVYLIDNEGVIYSSNTDDQLGSTIANGIVNQIDDKSEIEYNHVKYIGIMKEIDKNYRFVYLLPKIKLVKQSLIGMNSFIYISILLAVFLMVIAVMGTMRATTFIKDFSNAMRRVKGNDYDTKMEKYDNPALDELVDTFNSMTTEIKTLIRTTYESKILLHEMDIKFLQHQMNPHFLFNILLTIQIRAKMSGDETIYKMISSLSTLLRAGIYGDKRSLITIEEELKYVDYYLWLQKVRYEDRLTYTIDIQDDSILQCEIPRLIIEPIVENAIVHGVEKMSENASVSVTLFYDDEDLLIQVVDNGVGFDVSAVINNAGKGFNGDIRREKMGLNNTNQRIKLIYGESYGLNIQSQENNTKIEIRIPKRKLETAND